MAERGQGRAHGLLRDAGSWARACPRSGAALLGGKARSAKGAPLIARHLAVRSPRGAYIALAVGVVAAALPAWRSASVRIVDGLRAVG